MKYSTERFVNIHNIYMNKNLEDFPLIKRQSIEVCSIVPFNLINSNQDFDNGIHFFIDDYQFERVWHNPIKYIEVFRKYKFILSPDFSLYRDMPEPLNIWNTYRSRVLGSYYQEQGIKVIPTVSWSNERSFDYCFKGIEKGSIVAISNQGVLKIKENLEFFYKGFYEMIKKLDPAIIVIYGEKIKLDTLIPIVWIEPYIRNRFKKGNDI